MILPSTFRAQRFRIFLGIGGTLGPRPVSSSDEDSKGHIWLFCFGSAHPSVLLDGRSRKALKRCPLYRWRQKKTKACKLFVHSPLQRCCVLMHLGPLWT